MANYYIDLVNGTDGNSGTVHDGLREPAATVYTAGAGTDATKIVMAQDSLDNDAADNYNNDYLYNVTRGIGALISDYANDAGGAVLTVAIAGQTAGDTFYILRAWKTIEHYTTVAADVREAGDIAYIRSLAGPGSGAGAAASETVGAADIVFDEDGTAAALIKVVGCDATTNDPWGDASDTKPIIDFNGGAYQFVASGDDWWEFNRLALRNSNDTSGMINVGTSRFWRFVDCKFYDAANAAGRGLYFAGPGQIYISGGEFVDNNNQNLYLSFSAAYITGSSFNGGAGATSYGAAIYGAVTYFDTCTFGTVTAHGTSDITLVGGQVFLRNCTLTTLPASSFLQASSELFWEDCTMPNSWAKSGHANGCWLVQEELTTVRSGGGTVSAKILPLASGSVGGTYAPASLAGHYGMWPGSMVLWGEDETEYTVTVYIRPIDAWGTYPIASNLWLQASYLDHDTNKTRTIVKSNDALTGNDGSTWVAYDVTFTCKQAGPVYLDVIMTAYEAAKGIYVDLTPIVT